MSDSSDAFWVSVVDGDGDEHTFLVGESLRIHHVEPL